MTLADIETHVWDRLPTLQRTVAGRRVVGRLVRRAVRTWPVPVLEQCDDAEAAVVGKHMAKSLERQARQEVGMGIILTLVLGALVQEVVKILVRWWLERQENRTAMRLLVREARHHD
mgnify:CR=1 FL=1